jgi:hypothetical protein
MVVVALSWRTQAVRPSMKQGRHVVGPGGSEREGGPGARGPARGKEK